MDVDLTWGCTDADSTRCRCHGLLGSLPGLFTICMDTDLSLRQMLWPTRIHLTFYRYRFLLETTAVTCLILCCTNEQFPQISTWDYCHGWSESLLHKYADSTDSYLRQLPWPVLFFAAQMSSFHRFLFETTAVACLILCCKMSSFHRFLLETTSVACLILECTSKHFHRFLLQTASMACVILKCTKMPNLCIQYTYLGFEIFKKICLFGFFMMPSSHLFYFGVKFELLACQVSL